MAYCELSDLYVLLSEAEISDLSADLGDKPDRAVVEEAITKADALIDGYCEPRYGPLLPFTPVPDLVRATSADIALYHLFSRRTTMPEVRRLKYEDAVNLLKQVAAGRANIPGIITDNPVTAAPVRWYAI
jgi:phage gp36-like protein